MLAWFISFVIVQGIRYSFAKEPYNFVIFQGGGGGVWTPCPPPPLGSVHESISYLLYIGFGLSVIPLVRLLVCHNFLFPLNILRTLL